MPLTFRAVALKSLVGMVFLSDHAVEFRNLVGRVLKVGVHGYHHISFSPAEAGVERRRLAVVAAEAHTFHRGVSGREALYHLP